MAKDEGGEGRDTLGTIAKWLAIIAAVPAAAIAIYQIYAVATGKQSILDYIQGGKESAPTVIVAPPGGGVVVANCNEPREKEMWDKANTEKSRAAWGAYLASYASCPNANKARDILATACRTETSDVWESSPMFQSNQAVRGVGSIPDSGKTVEAACAAAKKMANDQAKTNCEAIAQGGGYRNPVWKVRDQDCACNKVNDLVTTCIADLSASCTWEAKIPKPVEICG